MPIPKIIVTAALMAAQVAIGMMRKTRGPRLDSLKTTTAEYGTPIPRFWGKRKFECPIIWAEDLRESKKTSKGKGGKMTEYRYYASFAVLICDHEIEDVTRVWMDDKLVYDATRIGPISFGGGKLRVGKHMRKYMGTETQMPDPRMEAWCEDRYGVDSCPAYRGSAYILFDDLPVSNFGNRIPNVTVEAVSAAVPSYPFEQHASHFGTSQAYLSPSFTQMVVASASAGYQVWDVPTRTLLYSGAQNSGHIGIDGDGGFYARDTDIVYASGGSVRTVVSNPGFLCGGNLFYAGGAPWVDATSTETGAVYVSGDQIVAVPLAFRAVFYFTDVDGNAWALGPGTGGFGIARPGVVEANVATGNATAPAGMDNGEGQFLIVQNSNAYLISKADFSIVVGPVAVSYNGSVELPFRGIAPGDSRIWIGASEYSTADLTVLRTINLANWSGAPNSISDFMYDPVNHAMWGDTTLDAVTVYFLDRVAGADITLKTIVDSVAGWCGLTGHDSTALTQPVTGYSVSQGTGKDMLAPLFDIHDVDARPHDFQVQFVNRGAAPTGSIETADFVREGDAARYTVTVQQDTDLPRRVTVNFADSTHDQRVNTVIAQRPLDAMDSSRDETLDLSTLVDTPDAAQRKVERYFRRLWNERERIKNGITAQNLALEPGDVTTLSLDGVTRSARLDKMTIRGSAIDCEWIRDETSLATLSGSTGATMQGSDTDVIVVPGPTRGFALDIPLVADADADINPLLYMAAGSYNVGAWAGATAYRGDDGTYDEPVAAIETANEATWGYTTSTLANANPNLWDRGNTLNVTVFGTLTSSTEAAINADPSVNLCAIGAHGRWELVNFTTATLTGTSGSGNTYTLSGFKRGRRGSEASAASHASDDAFLMLNMAHIVELGTDAIGDSISFKVQSLGRDPEDAAPITLTFAGVSLKPRAPAVRYISKDPATGDIKVHIAQRPRTGGNWNGGPIPVVEASESYELDIYSGATLKRTIAATASPITYSAADQTTDFGAGIATNGFDGELYQISAVLNRGFARTF